MPPQPDLRCIVTTFAKEPDAIGAIRTLLAESLIACGTLLPPARSIYMWKGKIEDSEEIVAVLKTSVSTAEKAAARLKEMHPYETPEILIFTPEAADAAYAQWVSDTCASQ